MPCMPALAVLYSVTWYTPPDTYESMTFTAGGACSEKPPPVSSSPALQLRVYGAVELAARLKTGEVLLRVVIVDAPLRHCAETLTMPCSLKPAVLNRVTWNTEPDAKESITFTSGGAWSEKPPPATSSPVLQFELNVAVTPPARLKTGEAVVRVARTRAAAEAPCAPVGPAGPAGPCAPGAPSTPAGPCAPGAPFAPVGPCGPGAPAGPCAPVAPSAPAGPCAPAAPSAPADPCAPVAPVAPAAPAGP